MSGGSHSIAVLTLLVPAAVQAAMPVLRIELGADGDLAGQPAYDTARGYGTEPNSPGAQSTRFSVRLPEGNYRITLRFGNGQSAARCTVKAEARRLMIEEWVTAAGEFTERSFIVNVRTPQLPAPPPNAPGGGAVRLKPHEINSPTWDDKLTLEFLGPAARITRMIVERADVPTVYLVGDSTVTDQITEPTAGWGQMLPRFFQGDVAVANHAESGETLKSFLTELRLDKLLASLRAGDWVLIQFGHNDEKAQWPQTYVEAGTTYRAYLHTYIAEVRRRGGIPVLVTPPERRNFDAQGRIVSSHGDYPEAVRGVAREASVALIDLYAMSKAFYEALGPKRAALAFSDGGRDHTHYNNYGAYETAAMIAQGIRMADPKLMDDLARHLAADVPVFDPSQPFPPEAFQLPASQAGAFVRPEGS